MRRVRPLALLLTALLQGQVPLTQELKPARVLAVGDRALDPSAPLLLAPEARTVAALGAEGLQVWDGRRGAVLRSTLPRPEPPRSIQLMTEAGEITVNIPGGMHGRMVPPLPPPSWDPAEERFSFADGSLHGPVSMRLEGPGSFGRQMATAAAPEQFSLHHEGLNGLRVSSGTGGDWILKARRQAIAGPKDAEKSAFSLVALASDGSRVAAFWYEMEWAGGELVAVPDAPPHLLIWRRGDALPCLDLTWEGAPPSSLDFTPSGKALLARLDHEYLMLDATTGREKAVVPSAAPPACWVPNLDRALFKVDEDARTYALWDLDWGEELLRFSLPLSVRVPGDPPPDATAPAEDQVPTSNLNGPAAISPDGRWIAATRSSAPTWMATEVVLFELES